MAKCQLTGKARKYGNKVSHSNHKTRVVKRANVQFKSIYDPETDQTVRMYLTTRALRTLDKMGLSAFIRKFGVDDVKVLYKLV